MTHGKIMSPAQDVFHTSFLRIESILQTCAKRLSKHRNPASIKILSFGCSIGDELASIKLVFPQAKIFGCDVNKRLLDICKKSFGEYISLFESSRVNIVNNGPYDLIVASAVLCRNPTPKDYAKAFPFSQFDDIVGLFDECLSENGIIAIPNSGYLFSDSSQYNKYTPIRSDVVHGSTFVDVFHKNGSVFLKQERSYGINIYSKHGDWRGMDEESAFDCIFEKSSGVKSPISFTITRVPGGLTSIATLKRQNIDYCPIEIRGNIIVTEHTFDIMADEAGSACGFALKIGWSSFFCSEIYRRPFVVWSSRSPIKNDLY